MIAALRFDRGGRPRFEPATNVRLDTVCAVANAVTEHVSRLLDRALSVDIFEPVTVPLDAQPALFADASVILAHGRRSDLLVIVRDRDARRLVACAFGVEPDAIGARPLSTIESQVLERIAREVAHLCTPLCGEITSVARANGSVDGYACTTYFEFRVASPVNVVIGIGLTRDPMPRSDIRLAASTLDAMPVVVTARLGRTRVAARRLAAFAVGTIVPFDTALADHADLLVGDVVVGHGQCGVNNGNHALRLTSIMKGNA